jgi:monoamine oxidase
MNKPLSRRHFLNLVGAAGGSTAIYKTSLALGLMQDTGPVATMDLHHVGRSPRRVVLLGAGVANLAIAYELESAGYDCTILEASHRFGGRNLTLRHGDKIDEMGYNQVCNFDDDPGLYFNAGPARIPGHHRRILNYCRKFGVPLQIKSNFSRPGYVHDTEQFGGKPIRVGEYVADARGFMSELLYKAVDKNVFDQPLSDHDQERLLKFAKQYGDLDAKGAYNGTIRAGYKSGGFGGPAELHTPIGLQALLDSEYWQGGLVNSENPDWGEPLMEAKGGMDNIVKAFARNLKRPPVLNAQVQSIQLTGYGVDVIYNKNGERKKFSADYCFNSIPTHFMPGIPNNLSTEYRTALASLNRGAFFKIGLQMKKRFWEDEGIYGGITNTNQKINQIWYPSYGIHGQKGVLLGTYAFGPQQSAFFERMTPTERIQFAADAGDNVHAAGYSKYIEAGVSIPWGRMNHMMGCGVDWSAEYREKYFDLLRNPDGGRHYMVGDQISYHSSWQEGALASAEFALQDLDQRVRAENSISRLG